MAPNKISLSSPLLSLLSLLSTRAHIAIKESLSRGIGRAIARSAGCVLSRRADRPRIFRSSLSLSLLTERGCIYVYAYARADPPGGATRGLPRSRTAADSIRSWGSELATKDVEVASCGFPYWVYMEGGRGKGVSVDQWFKAFWIMGWGGEYVVEDFSFVVVFIVSIVS